MIHSELWQDIIIIEYSWILKTMNKVSPQISPFLKIKSHQLYVIKGLIHKNCDEISHCLLIFTKKCVPFASIIKYYKN